MTTDELDRRRIAVALANYLDMLESDIRDMEDDDNKKDALVNLLELRTSARRLNLIPPTR